ncbi:hypothetical protein [Roseibium sp.]|uniref:hypothetical protein n=1 Tax=Roseibium sp. TaxID=1936156 RepID=UPI0032638D62
MEQQERSEEALTGETASLDQIEDIDRRLRNFRRDAARRGDAMADMFARVETVMRQIMATPLLQHDAHCQNLVAAMARAGTMEDFADRVFDFGFHINRILPNNTAAGAPEFGTATGSAQVTVARLNVDRPLLDPELQGGRKAGRRRLRL